MSSLFRTIGNFGPIDQLARQVNQLEANVRDAVRLLAASMGIYLPTPLKSLAYVAKVGELVPFDTSGASGKVTLPVPTNEIAGARIGVIRKSAANTLTVAPPSGKVQGGSSDTLPATAGLYEYVCHGATEGWWRRG